MKPKLSNYLVGFRRNYSTQHFLLRMVETWCAMLNKRQKVGATITDLYKAFDTLNQPCEPLAAAPGVVEGGVPCHVPTWVEHAQNNDVLKKIE